MLKLYYKGGKLRVLTPRQADASLLEVIDLK